MSEYKSKKSSSERSYKKPVGGNREKRASSYGEKKKSQDFDKEKGSDFKTKRSFDKPKDSDYKPKKRFDTEKGSDFKPKKRFDNAKDSDNKPKKRYDSESGTGYKPKKRFDNEKSADYKPKKRFNDDKGTDYKPKKRFGDDKSADYKPKRRFDDDKSADYKPKRRFDDEKGTGYKTPRKRIDRTSSTEKPLESKERSPKVVTSIKKRFSDTEKGNRPKTFDKKPYKTSAKQSSDNAGDDEKPVTRERRTSSFRDKRSFKPDKDFGSKSKPRAYSKPVPKSYGKKKSSEGSSFEGEIRLNRYIAASGMCSRREADELIELGEVKVNGVVVTEMGTKVLPTDKVDVGGQPISPERKVYVLLNKPKDFVSTVSDPHAERTVLDLINLDGHERIYPVGRLDKNTTGVMLLTNDGDLTKKLTHPSYNKKKVYHVVIDKPATKAHLQQIVDGFELEDGFISADAVSFVIEGDKTEIGIEIHSGRNRIVRRIFEYLGFEVVKLDRVYFAGLTKKNVPRGKWRYLSEKEVGMLKQGAYE